MIEIRYDIACKEVSIEIREDPDKETPAPPKFEGPSEISMADAHLVETMRFLKLMGHRT